MLYGIYRVTLEEDKRLASKELRMCIESLKVTIHLAKELQAFKNFKQFEVLSHMAYDLARQAMGWHKSLNRVAGNTT